jgi:hypothetical protein
VISHPDSLHTAKAGSVSSKNTGVPLGASGTGNRNYVSECLTLRRWAAFLIFVLRTARLG